QGVLVDLEVGDLGLTGVVQLPAQRREAGQRAFVRGVERLLNAIRVTYACSSRWRRRNSLTTVADTWSMACTRATSASRVLFAARTVAVSASICAASSSVSVRKWAASTRR